MRRRLLFLLTLLAAGMGAAEEPGRSVRVGPSTNGASELQAAVDKLARLGGGTVELAPGRYHLRHTLQLRTGVTLRGVLGKTVLVLGPGRKTALAKDVAKGANEITLADAAGFEVGDGIALEDKAGHGFEVTTAALAARLGPATFRLSQPAQSDYLVSRQGEVKHAFSGIGAWNIKNATVAGITVEGNFGQAGSEYLGGCRGGGIYLFACESVVIRQCTVRKYNGDAISFQGTCVRVTIEHCLCEENANVALHPGSGSHSSIVRHCIARKNGYVGFFVCVGVRKVVFEDNDIMDNAGCGISIGLNDTDNVFRSNRIINNAETGILFRRDSLKETEGAHRNVFEKNIVKDNLGPRPAKSNSRPASAGKACVVIEGPHRDLVFRDNDFGFSQPHAGAAILHDPAATIADASGNRLHHLKELTRKRVDEE